MRVSKTRLRWTLPLIASYLSGAGCALQEPEEPGVTAAQEGAGAQELAGPTTDGTDLAAASCVLYANRPVRTSNWIEATGGRTGCSNTVQIHVRIRQDISFLPDRTLAEEFVTAANHDSFLSFPCLGIGSTRKVFTETIVNGQKVQSERVTLPCD